MRPRVLHIINSFEQGGTERQAVQLLRLLRAAGRYEVGAAALNLTGSLLPEVEALNIGEVAEYRLTSFRDASFAAQVRKLARRLRVERWSVLHTHDFYSNVFGMTAAALARVPARVASKRDIAGFRTPAQNFTERCSFRLAHAVVVNSEAVRSFLTGAGVTSRKIVTIYNGLDLKRLAPPEDVARAESLAALGLPTGRRFVTIVANIQHEVKDHRMFLRAARRVKDALDEAGFVIAGEGRLLEELRDEAARLGLSGDVFFTGRCERVAELLSVSDVCVLTSKAEGFSNAILEYMAAARPCVVTDVGGAREAVEDGATGYVVPPGDDSLMAERVVSLLHEPERAREMGARARRVVEEKFSLEAQLERTHALYDRLLAANGRRSAEARAPAA